MLPVTGAMSARVEVIVNCNARRLGASSSLRRHVMSAFEHSGATVHATSCLEELEETARAIAGRAVDVVVLAGGDGAAMHGLSALAQAYEDRRLPHIALFPAGTVDTIARNTGARGTARGSPLQLATAVKQGTARARAQPTLRVRDDRGGNRVGFIFGAGLVARFFELYNASPRRGRMHASQIVARLFFGSLHGSALAKRVLERQPGSLRVDGRPEGASAWSLVLASVLTDVGLHFRVTYRARENPPRFHVVASGLGPSALGRQMPLAIFGMPLVGEPKVDTLALSLEFAFGDDRGAYVLDGDVLRASVVHVSVGPELTILTV
jgi:diacylglycerol kinase family enzyme